MSEAKPISEQTETEQTIRAMSAGVLSTIFMTMAMYAGRLLQFPTVDIFHILGNWFTQKRWLSTCIGAFLHFASGAVFSLTYVWLWKSSVGKVSQVWGLIFGAVHGVLANFLMRLILLPRHPRRPQSWDSSNSFVYIMTHLVFGFFVVIFYRNESTSHLD